VVGDGEYIEASPAIEVDELADAECAVAPRRVCVQLTEEQVVAHAPMLSLEAGPGEAER
jgi:hypothetical protein